MWVWTAERIIWQCMAHSKYFICLTDLEHWKLEIKLELNFDALSLELHILFPNLQDFFSFWENFQRIIAMILNLIKDLLWPTKELPCELFTSSPHEPSNQKFIQFLVVLLLYFFCFWTRKPQRGYPNCMASHSWQKVLSFLHHIQMHHWNDLILLI